MSPLPRWEPLRASSSSTTPSEDDILASSQEMRDELDQTPPSTIPPNHKRKLVDGGSTTGPYKRSRLALSVERHLTDNDGRLQATSSRAVQLPSTQPLPRRHPAALTEKSTRGIPPLLPRSPPVVSRSPVASGSISATKPHLSRSSTPPEPRRNVARKSTGTRPRRRITEGSGQGILPVSSLSSSAPIPSGSKGKSISTSARDRDPRPSTPSSDEDLPSVREIIKDSLKRNPPKPTSDTSANAKKAKRRVTLANFSDVINLVSDNDEVSPASKVINKTRPSRRQSLPHDVIEIIDSDDEPPTYKPSKKSMSVNKTPSIPPEDVIVISDSDGDARSVGLPARGASDGGIARSGTEPGNTEPIPAVPATSVPPSIELPQEAPLSNSSGESIIVSSTVSTTNLRKLPLFYPSDESTPPVTPPHDLSSPSTPSHGDIIPTPLSPSNDDTDMQVDVDDRYTHEEQGDHFSECISPIEVPHNRLHNESPNIDAIVPALDDMAIANSTNTSAPSVDSDARLSDGGKDIVSLSVRSAAAEKAVRTSKRSDEGVRHMDSSDASRPSVTPSLPFNMEGFAGPRLEGLGGDDQDSIDAASPIKPLGDVHSFKSPSSSPMRSPSRSIIPVKVRGSLYGGTGGFFKAVHRRRSSVNSPNTTPGTLDPEPGPSYTHPSPPPPATTEEPAPSDALLSPLTTPQAPSPDANAATESPSTPPTSSELMQTSLTNVIPDVQTAVSDVPLQPPVMRSHPGHKQEKTAQSALKATLINASFKVAEVSHSYIDLTISDSEDDYTRPAREADEAAALESTKRLAALLPDVLADTPPKIGPAHPDSLRASAALEARPGVEPTGSSAPRLDKIRNAKKRTLGKAHQNDTQFRAPVPAQEESYPDPGKDPQHSDNAEDNYTENSTVDVTSKRLRDTLPFYESRVLPLRLLISPEKSVTPGEDDEDERQCASMLLDSDTSDSVNDNTILESMNHSSPTEMTMTDDVWSVPRSLSTRAGLRRNPERASSRRSSSSASSLSLPDPPAHRGNNPRIQAPRTYSGVSNILVPALDQVHIDGLELDVYSWKKSGADLAMEFANVYALARDLPHDAQDRVNSLDDVARRGSQLILFESLMSENTASDEPGAPDIKVINDVDDELTPPFEFHYSNLMWHSDNVPRPDLDHLRSCECHGSCSADAKKCACVVRQQEAYIAGGYTTTTGFVYDARGKLRSELHSFPIFECNAFCGCDDRCRNRVVQHGRKLRINIQKTVNKGWGIFADERIPANTFVGIYAGEYLTDAEGNERGTKYDKFGRTYLFDIDFWHLKIGIEDSAWKPKYCIDAYHAGNFTRYLNHSCDPNCQLSPCYINEGNIEKPLLAIFTRKDIAVGQELCFSYTGPPDDDDDDNEEENNNPKAVEDDDTERNDAIYVKCRCGTRRCKGKMWL